MSFMQTYLAETARVIQALDEGQVARLVEILESAQRDGRQVLLAGNGGSGSLASHLACDLNKNCNAPGGQRFKVLPLTDNIATIMAYANDVSYNDVFVEQLKNYFQPGDVVIGISGSGNSENVVRTLRWARSKGGITIGFLGYGGGRCAEHCDLALIADSHDMQHVEDCHTVLMHLLMQIFMRKALADVG
ncbi:MAG: SIS domain-containing protein [Fimbriimonadaceae bacterium]|nr:SIS domain-containing protein [Fimbriimonadaceae bacterium]